MASGLRSPRTVKATFTAHTSFSSRVPEKGKGQSQKDETRLRVLKKHKAEDKMEYKSKYLLSIPERITTNFKL